MLDSNDWPITNNSMTLFRVRAPSQNNIYFILGRRAYMSNPSNQCLRMVEQFSNLECHQTVFSGTKPQQTFNHFLSHSLTSSVPSLTSSLDYASHSSFVHVPTILFLSHISSFPFISVFYRCRLPPPVRRFDTPRGSTSAPGSGMRGW